MDLETMRRDLSPDELMKFEQMFSTSDIFGAGVLRDISEQELQKYMSSPEKYKKQLSKYLMYRYITNGDVYQLYELYRTLPDLEYNIKSMKSLKSGERYSLECRRVLKEIDYKELTRDIIMELITQGTYCGLWVGREFDGKEIPTLITLPNLEYFYPAYRKSGGKWCVHADLSYFDSAEVPASSKYELIESLSPYITIDDYKKYKEDSDYRFIELPIERTVCIRVNTLRRNQRLGIPLATSVIYDQKHKDRLKNLETVISNKIMGSPIIVKIGLPDSEISSYKKIGEKLATSIFSNIKKGLTQDSTEGGANPVIGIPDFVNMSTLDIEDTQDVLDPEKYEAVNRDISVGTGVARGLFTGEGTNASVLEINLDLIYDKLAVILENIESQVFNKLFRIILPKSVSEYYYMEFDKNRPITNEQKIGILEKLASTGYAITPLLELANIDADEYINRSLYELETLKLRERIIPPLTSYTLTEKDAGRPSEGETDSETTSE